MKIDELAKHANNIRREIIEMSYRANGGHIGCSLDIVDILTVLYFEIMNINPRNPSMKKRDKLILSKGHAASALYAVLAERGYFNGDRLKEFMADGSLLAAHVTLGSLPGIEATSGSLGHGLSVGIGMAVAARQEKTNANTYVLIGDGEACEGSIWEGILFAGFHKINDLTLIMDKNDLQILGKSADVLDLSPIEKKLTSFNWAVQKVDGHNFKELIRALHKPHQGKPMAIIAQTVKGKGVSFMENKYEWHGKTLTFDDYQKAITELSSHL